MFIIKSGEMFTTHSEAKYTNRYQHTNFELVIINNDILYFFLLQDSPKSLTL